MILDATAILLMGSMGMESSSLHSTQIIIIIMMKHAIITRTPFHPSSTTASSSSSSSEKATMNKVCLAGTILEGLFLIIYNGVDLSIRSPPLANASDNRNRLRMRGEKTREK